LRLAVRAWGRLVYRPLATVALILLAAISASAAPEIDLPTESEDYSIRVQAPQASRWQQGEYDVWLLGGGVRIEQGDSIAQSRDAVLWVDRNAAPGRKLSKIIAYLENDVVLNLPKQRIKEQNKTWFGRFHTVGDITFDVANVQQREPEQKPLVFAHGVAARTPKTILDPNVKAAQFSAPSNIAAPPPENLAPGTAKPNMGLRRVRVYPRSEAPVQARWFPIPQRNERVAAIESGVNVIVDGLDQVGTIDLSADRIVIWTAESAVADFSGKALEDKSTPLEFYMEGNIVFRQGDRIIYADRMYYNVSQEYGVVMNAEVLTPIPEYQGLLRLKADVLQQIDSQNFQAYGAALTSSRLGVPTYWMQTQQVTFQDNQRTAIDPITGQPAIDPTTGEPAVEHDMLATSRNNFLYYGGYPIFYWPTIATNLKQPTYYVERVRVGQDRVFGFQVYTDLNAYQLFGFRNPPPGTKWQISADLLTDRGPAGGTNFSYDRPDFFGHGGPTMGFIDAWGLHDSGLDNLGSDRRALVPEQDFRGRVLAHHRQYFADGWQFTGELGFISDRNFLEQYFENEWDQYKDQTTGLELKRYDDTMSYSLTADARINDFFTQTQWLPRLDHYWLGQDVFNVLTFNAHTNVGYGNLLLATPPKDPVDAAKFDYLAWEYQRQGVRAATRQEIDYPVTLGPVKVVPYALGEAAHWGQTINEEDVTRLYGQAGVRASMPMWSVNRDVQSELFNVNGLAHKVVFDAEFLYADANKDLSEFPLYDPLDDDNIEHFRRRFYFNTFHGVAGGNVPNQFDERYFALRSGLQSNVASPSTEIADDLMLARFGIRQRWQTKRGLPGRERIVDLVTLDVQATFFPDAQRDNFGQDWGLVDYDFKWHVGDRFTVLSDGYADFFDQGLKTASIGGILTRPELGSLYVGYRAIDGPYFKSSIVNASINYRMSEKWILTAGSSYDFENAGNIGQTAFITRVGESFLIKLGGNIDVSRNNFSLQFAIEPRFISSGGLNVVGGVPIPPAGVMGLE
jgi:hypothetical protein